MTSDPTVIALLITTSAGFLTTIVNQVFQARKQASDREFDRQERMDAAKALDDAAQEKAHDLKVQVETRAAVLEEMAKQTAAKLSADIEANTKLTAVGVAAARDAYHEANNVNVKIAEGAARIEVNNNHIKNIAEETAQQGRTNSDTNVRVRNIEAVTVEDSSPHAVLANDTNIRVRNIETVVDHAPMLDPALKHPREDGSHAVPFKQPEESTK